MSVVPIETAFSPVILHVIIYEKALEHRSICVRCEGVEPCLVVEKVLLSFRRSLETARPPV